MRQLLVVALVFAGCRDKPAAPPASQGAVGSSRAAADPWRSVDEPSPPDTPESRRKRAEAALGRVRTIEPEVGKLRALVFDREVPAQYQTAGEFQAAVRREIAKELPPERSHNLSAALAQLGFLRQPVDIAEVEQQAMATQAGAYYDPTAKKFFLVMVPDNNLMLDTISAHELTHALQDQHFDLTRYLPSDGSIDDDAALARRFVAEGDATFVMLLYAMHGILGDKISPAVIATLRRQITQFASLGVDELKAMSRSQAAGFGMMDPEIKKSIEAMDDIPPVVLVPLLESYMKGSLVALTAYEHGGWPSVDALYRDPPASTEQVLHPETKLIPVRDPPRRVTLARTADADLLSNVLGELLWRIYFELWKAPHPAEAAEGWGGDRYAVARRKDGRLIGRIATTWDSAEDAEQFTHAYLASLAARFPGADVSHPTTGVARPDGGKVFVRTAGTRVFIVDGADDGSALDALVRTTTFD
ncbi:MAG TPA: hypothetical protein VHN14_25310 [Kofleriaceae bacterium]|jgi:hypothetical protein|nr:hypothetical protein [Kofleriaceae bacterium]